MMMILNQANIFGFFLGPIMFNKLGHYVVDNIYLRQACFDAIDVARGTDEERPHT